MTDLKKGRDSYYNYDIMNNLQSKLNTVFLGIIAITLIYLAFIKSQAPTNNYSIVSTDGRIVIRLDNRTGEMKAFDKHQLP